MPLRSSWGAWALIPPASTCGYSFMCGRSPRVDVVGLRMVNTTNGGQPAIRRALVRALLNLFLAASICGALLSLITPGESARITIAGSDLVIIGLACLIFCALVLGHHQMLRDPGKQTLQDWDNPSQER